MNSNQLSRAVFKAFKLRGLSLSAEATEALLSVLSREDDIEGSLRLILDEIKDRIEKQDVKSTIIDVETIKAIVVDLSSNEEDIAQESIQLYDAFNCPKLHFDERNRSYKVISSPPHTILGTAESRAAMYRERLLLTQQRLLRSDLFTLHGFSRANKSRLSEGEQIYTIESLLGSEGTRVLSGMLTQPEEGVWYLEDLTSVIRLDLSRAQRYNLFYTEHCHVVVQGEKIGDCFHVQVIGMPPAEDRATTLKTLGISDVFGDDFRPAHLVQMQALEEAAENHLVVIISELHLDKPLVLAKFQKILEGFEDNGIDPLYVLMGSFFSRSYNGVHQGKQVMKAGFAALAEVIAQCPRQRHQARFLFVPGPLDAGSSVALPKRPLPEDLVSVMKQQLTHVGFGSNPCKLRCYTQEIVLYREDVLKKMQKHLVFPLNIGSNPNSTNDDGAAETVPEITEQLVESLLDQAHLCPLPLHARPVHWELDHSLRLFPLPHLLVLADRTEQFSYEYKGCNTVNPGMFASDFSFVVYQPSTRSVQFSRVPE